MNRKNFLANSDVSILNYEVSDTLDSKGEESVDVILTIGKTQKEIENELENLTEDQIESKSPISFHEYEVIFTKKELKFLINEIEKHEKEGPDLEEE